MDRVIKIYDNQIALQSLDCWALAAWKHSYLSLISNNLTLEDFIMMGANYKTKKELKESVGKNLSYVETSLFGEEYRPNGSFNVVGPDAYNNRKWYATVVMKDGIIEKVK